MRTPAELRLEVKTKEQWKGSGAKSDLFNQAPVLKPAILDHWARLRM